MPIDFRRVFLAVSLIALPVSYLLLYGRMLTDPVQATGADFVAFYAAGRIARNEGPARAYDLDLQQRYEERVIGFSILPEETYPFPHPPFVVPLTQLVAGEDYSRAFLAWSGLMLVFLLLALLPLAKVAETYLDRRQRRILLAGGLLFFPAFVSLINGQNSALLLLGGSLWVWGLFSKRDWLAGLGLALMTVRPHLALPLALPFVFRQRGVFWWFAAGAGALALFSLAYAGLEGIEGFLRILFVSGRGEAYHINEDRMINFLGLLLRLLPDASPALLRLIAWGAYAATLVGLCLWGSRWRALGWREAGTAILLALFTAPHLHFHDLALLLIPLVGVSIILSAGYRDAVLLPLGTSLVLLSSYFAPILQYTIPYLFMLALFVGLWSSKRILHKCTSLTKVIS